MVPLYCRKSHKTLQIGSLIFSIVGNNKIDVLNADNDDRMKLNKMIDELGHLIPQAIKNIIHVSKEYESRICNVPSNTTLQITFGGNNSLLKALVYLS